MEQKTQVVPKKTWSLLHAILFMLKKGISKAKIFTDLNMMIKCGKIARKSLHNLLFHRHPHHLLPSSIYEFSGNNTPPYPHSLFSTHKKNQHKHHNIINNNNYILVNATVMKALEDMLKSATSSPGFVKSPVVKQLRIPDSPFPLGNGDEDVEVDDAADKFITRFYNDLRRQN